MANFDSTKIDGGDSTHLCILSLAEETPGETVADVVAILFSSQVLAFNMLFLYVSGGI